MNDYDGDDSCCSFFFNLCVSRVPRVFDFPSLQAYNPKNTNAFFTHLIASLERLGTSNLPSLCLNAVISRCGVEELSILLRRYWVAFWMSWTFIRYFVTLKVLRIDDDDDDDEGFAEVVETQNAFSRRSYFLFVSFFVTCILYWRGVFARVRVQRRAQK